MRKVVDSGAAEIADTFQRGKAGEAGKDYLRHYESGPDRTTGLHQALGAENARSLGRVIMRDADSKGRLESVEHLINPEDRAYIKGQHFLRVKEEVTSLMNPF